MGSEVGEGGIAALYVMMVAIVDVDRLLGT
jgi:hypothetical protein